MLAPTLSKLISNTGTLMTWLEDSGIGQVQNWNNLRGERSLSSQRLVISYVLDIPFGKGRKFLSGSDEIVGKAVSGWGVDGVTTFPAWISCKDHVEWERILRSKVPAWESEICGPMF